MKSASWAVRNASGMQRHAFGDHDAFGVAVAGEQRHHARPDRRSAGAGAVGGGHARALEAEDLALTFRRRVDPAALEQVGAVERRGLHVDGDLSGTEARLRDLFE